MAPHLLASAERSYRVKDSPYQAPKEWGEAINRGDFSVLPYTCVLDTVEDRGPVAEKAALYAALPDGSAIGRALGITRELVRLDVNRALETIELVDEEVAGFLRRGYDVSKHGGG